MSFLRKEIPKTRVRQRWAIKIKVGLDIADVLGLDPAVVDTANTVSQLVTSMLEDVGTVESLELVQNRNLLPRHAFGPNPQQAFQVIPQNQTVTLRMSKAVLKDLPKAEKIFSFAPSNLILQQLPFVLQITDVGGSGNDNSDTTGDNFNDTAIRHFIYGCWFADSSVKWDVTSRDDQRTIQTATIKAGRIFTLDPTLAGSPAASLTRTVFGGVLASQGAQNALDDFNLT